MRKCKRGRGEEKDRRGGGVGNRDWGRVELSVLVKGRQDLEGRLLEALCLQE